MRKRSALPSRLVVACALALLAAPAAVSCAASVAPAAPVAVAVPGGSAQNQNTSGDASAGTVITPGTPVSVAGTDLTISVEGVEDSRCPAGVNCVWAGEVAVTIKVAPAKGEPATYVLHTMPDTARDVNRADVHIHLVDALPRPSADAKTKLSDYRITLLIEKK